MPFSWPPRAPVSVNLPRPFLFGTLPARYSGALRAAALTSEQREVEYAGAAVAQRSISRTHVQVRRPSPPLLRERMRTSFAIAPILSQSLAESPWWHNLLSGARTSGRHRRLRPDPCARPSSPSSDPAIFQVRCRLRPVPQRARAAVARTSRLSSGKLATGEFEGTRARARRAAAPRSRVCAPNSGP